MCSRMDLKICLLFVFAIFSIIIVMILNAIEFSHHAINFLPPNEEVWSSLLILDLLRATNFVCCHNNHANFDWNNHEKFYLYEKFLLCFNAVLQLRVASVVFGVCTRATLSWIFCQSRMHIFYGINCNIFDPSKQMFLSCHQRLHGDARADYFDL